MHPKKAEDNDLPPLIHHLYFDRIYPILPIESTLQTFSEVEEDPFYISCRAVVMQVAISENMNGISEQTLALIQLIIKDDYIISSNISEDAIHSILVLLRLLSDSMEYYWDHIESYKESPTADVPNPHQFDQFKELDKDENYELQKKFNSGSVMGYSTNRPCFHQKPPNLLNPDIASKLIRLCSKVKFNTRTLEILQNMCSYLYPSTPLVYNNILPEYQEYLKQKNFPEYTKMIDITIGHILRFVTASNPNEYFDYVSETLKEPLLPSTPHINISAVIQQFELLCFPYLTKALLPKFLELIKIMFLSTKKQLHKYLLLFYSSKALVFWVMARPQEYVNAYLTLKANDRTDQFTKSVSDLVNSLFDEIYSTFNVSALLTNNHNSSMHSPTNLNTNVPAETHSGSSASTPLSSFNNNGTNNNNGNSPLSKQFSKVNTTGLTSTTSTTSSPSSPYGSNASTNSITKASINSLSTEISTNNSIAASSQQNSGQSLSRNNSVSNIPTLNALSLLASPKQSVPDLEQFSQARPPPIGSYPTTHKMNVMSHMDQQSKRKHHNPVLPSFKETDLSHLENILDLYTHFDDFEPVTHTSVLRFLCTLLMLDSEVFIEINTMSFKKLLDSEGLDKPTRSNTSANATPTEKPQHAIHFAHNLKKFTSLQRSKKKSVKFVAHLVKNLNGTHLVSDITLLDSLRSILTLLAMTSSASLNNEKLSSVTFSRRLIAILGVNLNIAEKWDTTIKPNSALISCLRRYTDTFYILQLKYFSSAIQLEPELFLDHLSLNEITESLDLQKLKLYTESFRIFFHLPSSKELRKKISFMTSDFFKTLFCTASDITLQTFPYFEDKVEDIVNSILDGTLLDEHGVRKSLQLGTPSSMTSLGSSPAQNSSIASSHNSLGEYETQWSPLTMSNTSVPLSPHPMTTSLSNSVIYGQTNTTTSSNDHPLFAPKAKRPSINKNRTSLISASNDNESVLGFTASEDPRSPSISAQLMTVTSSTPLSRNNKSPFRNQRARRYSEEGSAKFIKGKTGLILEQRIAVDSEDSMNARSIMINIFSIFKRMTSHFILPHDQNSDLSWVRNDFLNIIKPIFVAIIEEDETLQDTAQAFMDVVINYIENFSKNTTTITVHGYFLICTYTICLFSLALFDLNIDPIKREALLGIVINFLKLRSYLATASKGTPHINSVLEAEKSTFQLTLGSVGRAIFVSLYTSEPNIQKLSKAAFTQYHNMIQLHENLVGTIDPSWISNIDFVEAISKDNSVGATGSVAFQRRVRNTILKHARKPDSILLDSIHIIFKKWYHYTKLNRTRNQREISDLRNFAGILAALSGIFLSCYTAPDKEFEPFKEHIIELTKKFDYFIFKQCQWLDDADLLTRENSRDIISIELHPLSFRVLFQHLRGRLDEIVNQDLSVSDNESSFILLEQVIIIVRTILRRDDDEKVMILFSIDIIELIDQLVAIIKKMPRDSQKYYKAIIHMSKMFKAMEHSEINLGIKHHYVLKNKWLKLVTNWFKSTIMKECDLVNLSKPHREMDLKRRDLDFLYIDTSIEASKAIAYLTESVPLEIYTTASEEELQRSKSIIFGNYFNILLKGLDRSKSSEKFPVSLRHKMNILNENVTLALTNLSDANIEASLQFTLPMGYSDNKNTKIAFLKVFTNNLSKYPLQNMKVENDKLLAMDQLLKYTVEYPELTLSAAMVCPAHNLDDYAAVLVNGFETRNAGYIVVAQLIKDEIKKASRPMDILRRNSCATRALALLSKYKGADYLSHTLRAPVQRLVDNQAFFEIEKLQPGDPNAEAQLQMFVKCMTDILDSITDSISYFPQEFFYICQTIFNEVKQKFPNYAYVAVGSFLFLRFFCPALVSPATENIIETASAREKRPLITLAKVIQNIANRADNLAKWPILEAKSAFLQECSLKIFNFLTDVCDPTREVHISIRSEGPPKSFDFDFLHKFLYNDAIQIRKFLLRELKTMDDFGFFKETFLFVDRLLGQLGQPKKVYNNELPEFIRSNSEKYPRLYEFMSRLAFKNYKEIAGEYSVVRESLSADGLPVVTFTLRKLHSTGYDIETALFKLLQVYMRIWTSKHYFILDCTEFDKSGIDLVKLASLMKTILPSFVAGNCATYYVLNANNDFIESWSAFFERENPFISNRVAHVFINSHSDEAILKSLKFNSGGVDVLLDMRVSLHDITLYDEKHDQMFPISLKIGNKYFQVLHEMPRQLAIEDLEQRIDLKINEVFEISEILSVNVSSFTGASGEFVVNLTDQRKLIFCCPKYLEIVKMFHHAKAREENEYTSEEVVLSQTIKGRMSFGSLHNNELVGHLLLVMAVGLFSTDKEVKNLSYNLIAATETAFNLDFGTHFHRAPEVFVPADVTTFLSSLSNSLSKSHPELTPYIWKYFLEGLQNSVIPSNCIPQTICVLSYWVPNLYDYVYLGDDEEGAENLSMIFRSLIKLTVMDDAFGAIYLHELWFLLCADGRMPNILVNEIVGHCLERDSENKDWDKTVALLAGFPTIEITSNVVKKLLHIINSFLPSLKMETRTHSWSELKILIKVTIYLFFESPLLTQMFLPEILFIISLLIDVGPTELRLSLFELLMNVCSSLSVNEALPIENKRKIDEVTLVFSRQKTKFMFGFSQDKGRMLQKFSASSFASKFSILDNFVSNILLLMEYSSTMESRQWKSKYKKYLTDSIFNNDSFLSARAMMILGILGKNHTSEGLCKNLLMETMKIMAYSRMTDEQLFLVISQSFTYSKLVEGLDPSSELLKRMFWLGALFADSLHPGVFEGGLLLMSNCVERLYDYHFQNTNNKEHLSLVLMKAKDFAVNLISQLDDVSYFIWREDTFTQTMLAVLSKGLSIPSVKSTATNFLRFLFRNSYREQMLYQGTDQYKSYAFLLSLVSGNDQFDEIMKDIEFDGEVVNLGGQFKMPKFLCEWLESDTLCPNLALYQAASLFTSPNFDEPSKLRFTLIMKYLLNKSPKVLFKFYSVVRQELRKFSSYDQSSGCMAVVFEIASAVVQFEEYYKLNQYNEESLQTLKKLELKIFDGAQLYQDSKELTEPLTGSGRMILYRRKKIITMVISRMARSS
ncbi:hypothetical protein KAFR_0C01250 [Kazachstania africana CBS 2517]|uniref:Ras-GAP domain-containing protein n=1 Tax=Kazachstania africana (strain ATCC 22294 / BCRC 22015 / CBS 2517 / CECT 1963 / NBRC 1671 / NRRL Y-8276) TaxID=1071382 RepID=H2ARX0_KAZAF|nr:hypothetical protein KAFR_0C01250 [Kazachstania africana CBS 2517]CCF57120.1 hypothetical protein KAFR_0C01250 [Kazachstania africana CBS 2517]